MLWWLNRQVLQSDCISSNVSYIVSYVIMGKLLDLFVCSFIDWMIMSVVNKRMFEYFGNAHETAQCLKEEIQLLLFLYQEEDRLLSPRQSGGRGFQRDGANLKQQCNKRPAGRHLNIFPEPIFLRLYSVTTFPKSSSKVSKYPILIHNTYLPSLSECTLARASVSYLRSGCYHGQCTLEAALSKMAWDYVILSYQLSFLIVLYFGTQIKLVFSVQKNDLSPS